MMGLAFFMFLVGAGLVVGAYALVTYLPGAMAARRLDKRLHEVSLPASATTSESESTVVKRLAEGPLPALDKMVEGTKAGSWLTRLLEQSGTSATPSAIIVASVALTVVAALVAVLFTRYPLLAIPAAIGAGALPFLWLVRRRSMRLKRFEEQFPEALDLLSRAIRAGHAFQTAMGMVADELPAPVGPEFKKTFEQQNYGLPLREALLAMPERVPLMDVHFFVTAVLIQRDTGGNLSEILDNLARVVRERFKLLRQVRVHTAHGRMTGYVLLSVPAALGIVLSMLNRDHMAPLFKEHMGQMMLLGAGVMQTIGYFWIKKVIKIEV
jgi:tight adherence protein B